MSALTKLSTAELEARKAQLEAMAQGLALSGLPMAKADAAEHARIQAELARRLQLGAR